MKYVFQLIGFIMVVLVLVTAVLCYLDSKDLLVGSLSDLISTVRECFARLRYSVLSFLQATGIADDAADLLDDGANYLREKQTGINDAAGAAAETAPAGETVPAGETADGENPVTIVIVTPAP